MKRASRSSQIGMVPIGPGLYAIKVDGVYLIEELQINGFSGAFMADFGDVD